MKTQINLLVLVVAIVTFSCKEVDEFIPVEENVPFEFGREFTDASDTLVFELNLVEPIIIRTPRGTEFVFKPDMFTFENGSYCICEEVTVKIIELEKKRDYLVHQASTVSAGQMLISAGAYHISAFADGKPLQLSQGHLACFWLPSENLDPDMQLYFGKRTSNGFDWTPANDASSFSSVTPGEWRYNDTTSFIIGYQCFSDRLEWINVDKIASEGAKNPVCLKLGQDFTVENSVVFAVLKKENSILAMNYSNGDGFCISSIPVGMEVTFVGIRKKGDGLYELAKEVTKIEENHFQSLDFIPTSFDEIKAFLSSL